MEYDTREAIWLLQEKYDGIESPEYQTDLGRLRQGEPLAYIIGWMPFCHTRIWLDSRPLIPRSETEFWTLKAIENVESSGISSPRILDLCAGSGCIGIAMLKDIPNATCDFVEIDESHHATILHNVIENGISPDRVRIFGGSLFDQVIGMYDVIVSNPPYIDPERSEFVQESVLAHEPEKALFGGSAGMELVSEIFAKSLQHLNPKGVLYIEHEPEQVEAIQKLSPGIQRCPDQYGVMRYSILRKE